MGNVGSFLALYVHIVGAKTANHVPVLLIGCRCQLELELELELIYFT